MTSGEHATKGLTSAASSFTSPFAHSAKRIQPKVSFSYHTRVPELDAQGWERHPPIRYSRHDEASSSCKTNSTDMKTLEENLFPELDHEAAMVAAGYTDNGGSDPEGFLGRRRLYLARRRAGKVDSTSAASSQVSLSGKSTQGDTTSNLDDSSSASSPMVCTSVAGAQTMPWKETKQVKESKQVK